MAEFNLTEGPDTIIGTGSDDTITGGTAALGTQDNITGGGGRDRLESGTVPQGTQAPTISDVEELILNTAGLPFSVRNVTNNSYTGNTTSPTFVIDTQTGLGQDDFVLYFDEDGDGTIEKAVTEIDTASNVSDLGTEDFTIV